MEIQYTSAGIHLPRLGLWLDATRPRKGTEPVFVSHAHSDHIGAHREVILTEATDRLMSARVRGERTVHRLNFGEPRQFKFGELPFEITLHGAGHVFGSAMALIESAGKRMLYTGDFQSRPNPVATWCDPKSLVRIDTLIMETTFGRPQYRLPPAADLVRQIVEFCRTSFEQQAIPVLQAYSLGKSQELLACLGESDLPVQMHKQAFEMTAIHRELGCSLPAASLLESDLKPGHVIIAPPGGKLPAPPSGFKFRTAAVTGWAMDSGARFRFGTDAAFPLSDHADFDALIEFVRQVNPRRVLTTHGFASDFAWTLRDLGFDARTLAGGEQMTLRLGGFSEGEA